MTGVDQKDHPFQHIGGASRAHDGMQKTSFVRELLLLPALIRQSRLGRRVAIVTFAAVVMVQATLLTIMVKDFHGQKLEELRQNARSMFVAVLIDRKTETELPVSLTTADSIIGATIVDGFAIYGLDQKLIKTYGKPVMYNPFKPMPKSLSVLLGEDSSVHEAVLLPTDLGSPYYVTVRLDATSAVTAVRYYLYYSLAIIAFVSLVITVVVLAVMTRWLLSPIVALCNNLLQVVKNPENPDLFKLKGNSDDEIGTAIKIAGDLVLQNANNLKRLRSQAEEKIHKLAYYDTLTGLPNRTFFIEKLEDGIRGKVVEEDRRLVVLSVDLDHFKDINDTMGHEFGDKLLEAIGKRLVKALPEDSMIARASADEFTVMAVLRPEQTDSSLIVDSILNAMAEPVSIAQERFQVRVSIGVAQCPDDGMEARQIMKAADIALNRAKEEGRDTVRYYSQDFDMVVQQRFQLLRDLREALDKNQLSLHYHPQFDLKTGQMIGAEALLRWWRPDNSKEGGSYIPPADFIPVAEQSGLIVPISEWVLRMACATNKSWQDRGLPPMRIAVNVSGIQFHKTDIVSLVADILKETKMDSRYLELEVTESVFMENVESAIEILSQLHRIGVEIAVDDFGTGYSSLSYLRQFPIDRLKIDQSFTRNALISPGDRMITKTIITLGHSLNLKVIAEGVESSDHENFLKEEGCDEVQGYKYTRPLPEEKFWEYAVNYNRNFAKNTKLTVITEDRA